MNAFDLGHISSFVPICIVYTMIIGFQDVCSSCYHVVVTTYEINHHLTMTL